MHNFFFEYSSKAKYWHYISEETIPFAYFFLLFNFPRPFLGDTWRPISMIQGYQWTNYLGTPFLTFGSLLSSTWSSSPPCQHNIYSSSLLLMDKMSRTGTVTQKSFATSSSKFRSSSEIDLKILLKYPFLSYYRLLTERLWKVLQNFFEWLYKREKSKSKKFLGWSIFLSD